MPAAIHARYSSDPQRAASIGDQVELCRRHAAGQGCAVVEVHADRAQSGAGRHPYEPYLALSAITHRRTPVGPPRSAPGPSCHRAEQLG